MPTTHAFTSEKSDGGDATLVRPSNWNAPHTGDSRGGFVALDYGTDGTAIQSAIAACNSSGGGEVIIGPGTWALGTNGRG